MCYHSPMPWRALLLGLPLGALTALALPPHDHGWLLWPALAGYLGLLHADRENARRGAWVALAFGTGYYFASLFWIIPFLKAFGGMHGAPAALLLLGLCAYLGAFHAYAFLATRLLSARWFLWAFPAAFWAAEALRARLIGGFPWNPLCLPLTSHPFLLQPASLVGAHGLSALLVFAVLGVVVLLREHRPALTWVWAGVLTLAAGWSAIALHQEDPGEKARVAVIQLDLDERKRYFEGDDLEGLRQAVGFTQAALKQGPDIVLWPESVFIHGWEEGRGGTAEAIRLSREVPLLLNANWFEGGRVYNSALLLRRGEIVGRYAKRNLVPFGEYLPFRPLVEVLGLKVISRSISDFSRGLVPGVMKEPVPMGIALCYEIVFPHLIRPEVRGGAHLLAVLTNDAWYGFSGAPEQHFKQALLRSVEFHRPLARAALTGISGFADAHGRVIEALPSGRKGPLVADLVLSDRTTPYAVTGDAVPLALAAGFIGLAAMAGFRRFRLKKQG
jgi:apolipoprotein N-acyltransferase